MAFAFSVTEEIESAEPKNYKETISSIDAEK